MTKGKSGIQSAMVKNNNTDIGNINTITISLYNDPTPLLIVSRFHNKVTLSQDENQCPERITLAASYKRVRIEMLNLFLVNRLNIIDHKN